MALSSLLGALLFALVALGALGFIAYVLGERAKRALDAGNFSSGRDGERKTGVHFSCHPDEFTGDQIAADDLQSHGLGHSPRFVARDTRNGLRVIGGYSGTGSPDGLEPPSGGTSGRR